jgi:predicted amidophosphoribosyltransferase
MHLKYLHYFGNESSDSILETYGIITEDKVHHDTLKSKQCPNCNEPNKPDSKFCSKCRMVLTYDAYSETIGENQQKESELGKLKEKQEQDISLMREEMEKKFQEILAKIDVVKLE